MEQRVRDSRASLATTSLCASRELGNSAESTLYPSEHFQISSHPASTIDFNHFKVAIVRDKSKRPLLVKYA